MFSLRYNKLHVNKKTYSYDPAEDTVYEVVNSHNTRAARNQHNDNYDPIEGTSS